MIFLAIDTHSYHFHSNFIIIIQHNHLWVISLRNDWYYSFIGHSRYEWLRMTTDIGQQDWMTGMRLKWLNDRGRSKWDNHRDSQIVTSFNSFWCHFTLRVRDWQSEIDLDSICTSCAVQTVIFILRQQSSSFLYSRLHF